MSIRIDKIKSIVPIESSNKKLNYVTLECGKSVVTGDNFKTGAKVILLGSGTEIEPQSPIRKRLDVPVIKKRTILGKESEGVLLGIKKDIKKELTVDSVCKKLLVYTRDVLLPVVPHKTDNVIPFNKASKFLDQQGASFHHDPLMRTYASFSLKTLEKELKMLCGKQLRNSASFRYMHKLLAIPYGQDFVIYHKDLKNLNKIDSNYVRYLGDLRFAFSYQGIEKFNTWLSNCQAKDMDINVTQEKLFPKDGAYFSKNEDVLLCTFPEFGESYSKSDPYQILPTCHAIATVSEKDCITASNSMFRDTMQPLEQAGYILPVINLGSINSFTQAKDFCTLAYLQERKTVQEEYIYDDNAISYLSHLEGIYNQYSKLEPIALGVWLLSRTFPTGYRIWAKNDAFSLNRTRVGSSYDFIAACDNYRRVDGATTTLIKKEIKVEAV